MHRQITNALERDPSYRVIIAMGLSIRNRKDAKTANRRASDLSNIASDPWQQEKLTPINAYVKHSYRVGAFTQSIGSDGDLPADGHALGPPRVEILF